jgi:hypothetical protein
MSIIYIKRRGIMKGIFITLVVISFLSAGCVPPGMMNVRSQYLDIQQERVDSFNIGQVQEKTVGETIVFRVDGSGYKGMRAVRSFFPPRFQSGPVSFSVPSIESGYEWAVIRKVDGGGFFLSRQPPQMWYLAGPPEIEYCVVADAQGKAYGDVINCALKDPIIRVWGTSVDLFQPKSGLIYKEGSFRQELIYGGKSKDFIRFQYREFKNDFARPAFFQELSYDLSESKSISFRSMRIEIIEATNSSIKFIVQKGLD